MFCDRPSKQCKRKNDSCQIKSQCDWMILPQVKSIFSLMISYFSSCSFCSIPGFHIMDNHRVLTWKDTHDIRVALFHVFVWDWITLLILFSDQPAGATPKQSSASTQAHYLSLTQLDPARILWYMQLPPFSFPSSPAPHFASVPFDEWFYIFRTNDCDTVINCVLLHCLAFIFYIF